MTPTMRSLLSALALALVALPAAAVEIRTATGPASFDAPPKRVAVFDLAALDTLERLGVAPVGVPNQLYLPEFKRIAAKAAPVGTLFEPDLEALNAAEPDLVIVGSRSSPRAAATRRVAPTIDMTITGADLIAQAEERLAAYGALFGKEAEAAAAKAELDAAVAKAREAAAGKGSALILMTNGPKITAYGANSRFGWMLNSLGLTSAIGGSQSTPHGESVSFEFVAKANPDWLIVIDRAAAIGANDQNAKATLDNELVAGTTAWKKKQVVYLPAADVYIAAGGVQATGRVLARLTKAFSGAE
ncbi:siderophore ABC transporter substrate-binding protein [Methylopila turkensis]|uniref:Iron ABC transporter substrate-binding protein n=1 Tax=Methylopila turkensis TaxID=1437816 RepID=A0A9W6JNB2_9HYPH|nr:siderophore ABC transporter substrate-binding protein [Methylopila turkensis]GLK80327.1 iron ABC transporter substrate-binding protein [Methylopila turkensis]